MNSIALPPLQEADADEEISALIATLHATGKRLEELTGGEVDSVADPEGGTFLLRHAQDRVRHRQAAKQAAILDALPAHIAMLDSQGVIVSVNGAWRKFADANALQCPGHAIGLNYLEICDSTQGESSAVASAVAEGIRAVLAGKEGFSIEYACHSPSERRWFILRVTPLADAGPRGVVVMHVNITESRQAEEAMQKQQTELRVLFDLMPALIWFKDTKNNFLRANQRVVEATGKPIEEIEGKSALEIYPRDAAAYYADDLQVIRSGTPKLGIVERLRGPDEQDLWIQTDKVPYCDKQGKVIGIVVMAQDITERKQAEQRIAEQAALIDETRDAIVVTDLDRRVTFWNKGAERLYGWTAEEAKGCPLNKMLQVDAEKFKLASQAVRLTGEWNGEIQKIARRGAVLMVDSRWTLMRDALGRSHSILTVDTDITERKKSEKQFLRSQRMESIGTLAGGIAHDLNNVLAPILMGVDFMKLKYPGASDILERFEISANRGAGMVRQLLTFAKGAEGERVSIQTTHLVMEIKELMQGTFPKNIELRVSCEPGLPTVLGDASQLHQILLNLCVNARDAMPSGGTLTVEARSLNVDTIFATAVPDAKPGRYVVLRVRDTGTGIPAALLERIFDPFFTTKGPDKGTGLGLSTVMGIAKGLGGFLHVDSTPGEGSTFDVHLPAEMEGFNSARAPAVEPDRGGQGETILLVDDETGVLEVGRMVLTDLNYKVLTAIDGAHGLVKAIENSRELRAVITDMHMPHMDGLAFVHALHRVLPGIPVIIGSGRLDDAIAEELKLMGVTERLDKPYTQPMLAAMLSKVMAGAAIAVA